MSREHVPPWDVADRATIAWPIRGSPMFFLFSNKLDCLGSVAISLIVTLVLLALLQVI